MLHMRRREFITLLSGRPPGHSRRGRSSRHLPRESGGSPSMFPKITHTSTLFGRGSATLAMLKAKLSSSSRAGSAVAIACPISRGNSPR